jgi:hypothetical protein
VVEGRSVLGVSGRRQTIEGLIYQLNDFFFSLCVERHRAKTVGGLPRRVGAKVAAYSWAQRINGSLGGPLGHMADLLI